MDAVEAALVAEVVLVAWNDAVVLDSAAADAAAFAAPVDEAEVDVAKVLA